MGSFPEKSDEELARVSIDTDQVDTGAQLVAGVTLPLDPGESLRIRYGSIQINTGVVSSTL
jgi:hypothetical protein